MKRWLLAPLNLALAMLLGAAVMWGWQHHRQPASFPAPGAVELGFAQTMLVHHQQAVLMTQLLLARGETRLPGLARAMQTAQLVELGQMKGWLQLWQAPLLPSRHGMDWMRLGRSPPDEALQRYLLDCQRAPGGMPGFASSDELDQLRRLDGAPRDALFLQLMIRHHEGALPMARFTAVNTDVPALRALATQILAQQAEELAQMRLLQRSLSGVVRQVP